MSEEKEILVSNYLAYLSEERLMGTKCADCGNIDLPARRICSGCQGLNVGWIDLTSDQGTLQTYSCVHVGTTRFVERGYNMKNPYAFGVVTLDSGPSITGLLVDVDPKDPGSIKVGQKMKVSFVKTEKSNEPGQVLVDIGFSPA